MGLDGLLSVLHSVSSAENNYFNIYIDGLDDQVFCAQTDQLSDVIQNISSLLAKATSRPLGLRLLNKFLDQCGADVFNKTGNLWTSLALKACHNQDQPNTIVLAYEALGKIALKSLQVPELTKSFATGHLAKIYESLNIVPITCAVPALRCVELCLRLYPSSSGPSRRNVEKYLSKFHDSLDADIVLYSGKCLHLLQQVSGGEVRASSQKAQWKSYQIQLAGSIHAVFNEMFANCNEIWDDNIVQDQLAMEELVLSHEPVNRAAQLYIRYHNLVQYLISALKEPFPTEKPMLSKMLLGVINRGLSVTCNLLHQNPITDNIALALLMPKVHIDLLQLLDALTTILRGHILPFYSLILGLLMDIMKSTSCADTEGRQKPFALLRVKIYESLSLWCKIQSSGSRCDAIAENLFNEILADISPKQSELTLQVCAGAGKHMSKKMKRQLHKAQNDRSKISQNAVKGVKNNSKVLQKEDRNQLICTAALRCLQDVLLSVSLFIKPTKIKLLQTTIVQICANFYELPMESDHLYSSPQCRLEISNVLYVIVTTPHHLSPPPMDLILTILNNACSRDGSFKVRNHCNHVLQNLEKLIHPQKESLIFPVDARDIRNTFIMMGQERLLDDDSMNELPGTQASDDDSEVENGRLEQKENNETAIDLEKSSESNDEDVMLVEEDNDDDECVIVPTSSHEEKAENDKTGNNLSENDDCQIVSHIVENVETPKSPEIVLHVDEDCDSPTSHQIGEYDTDEPVNKKSRISETTEQEANDDANAKVTANGANGDLEDVDDDQLLADIAADFVDDLA